MFKYLCISCIFFLSLSYADNDANINECLQKYILETSPHFDFWFFAMDLFLHVTPFICISYLLLYVIKKLKFFIYITLALLLFFSMSSIENTKTRPMFPTSRQSMKVFLVRYPVVKKYLEDDIQSGLGITMGKTTQVMEGLSTCEKQLLTKD